MKAHAVVVGVDRYDHFRALSYCSNDAIEVARSIQSHYREVRLVGLNTKADGLQGTSSESIRLALEGFKSAGLTQKDVGIFYFAGHGVSVGGRDFLLASDTSRDEVAQSAIAADDVVAGLLDSGAGTSVLILDACRSVPDRSVADFGKFTSELARRKGVLVFFGCSPGESCQELAQLEHGVFTHAFLAALESQRPATALALDADIIERTGQICSEFNLALQSPYTVVAPVQKAAVDLLTGSFVPQSSNPPCSCIVIAGPPNSGKTTVGQYLARTRGFLHLEMSSFAWRRYDADGDQSISIQDYMEQVVWSRGDLDIIARDLLNGLTNPSRVVICGPRTVEEVEVLRSQGWDFELIFLHANSSVRFNRYRTALEKHNRWNPSYRDVVLRDYKELSWGLVKIPSMSGAEILLNESSLTDLHSKLDSLVDRRFPIKSLSNLAGATLSKS